MNKYPKVSIIIPLYVICDRFFEDLKKFAKVDYPDYEIIVVSDKKVNLSGFGVKLILTGRATTGPAEKRDIAIKEARGEICAFIDDDAYPDPNWLKNAIRHFENPNIVAVGGPGVTPKEDGYWEQLSGMVYESYFCSSETLYRFTPLSPRYIKDHPAYNLLVRKKILNKVGGYSNSFYGGEDTFLCLKLIKYGKIYYEPQAIIYHHRRRLIPGLLLQISNVGMHRGYFAKKFPETSRQLIYFIPSIITLGFFALLFYSFFSRLVLIFFITTLVTLILATIFTIKRRTGIFEKILASIGVIMVHISYGTAFIKGLLIKDLKR